MDDDLYVNSGDSYDLGTYYPGIPKERQQAEAEAASLLAASYPALGSIHTWLQEQIDACNDLHNIQMTSMTINGVKYGREASIEAQILAYQLLKEKFIEKLAQFEAFRPEVDA